MAIEHVVGTRYFKYDEATDSYHILRILKEQENRCHELEVLDENKGKKVVITSDRLMSEYTVLNPDGFIIITIVKVGDQKDVILSLFEKSDILTSTPYAICRQSISDVFSLMQGKQTILPVVGLSISRDTCPTNVNFMDCLACDSVVYNRHLAIYMDDDVDSFLGLIRTRKFDTVLAEYELRNQNNYFGMCRTLKELLNSNHFMADLNRCFHIMELPYVPQIDEEGHLNLENVLYMEDQLQVNIYNTYVVEYTRDLDLDKIYRNYTLAVGPGKRTIYIVGYDKADGKYVPRTLVKPTV